MHTGCTEGTRNVKSKVVSSLASKFQEVYLRVPFHSIQTPCMELQCKIPRQQCQGKCGGKNPQNKTRIKLIYSVSCAICLVTYKLSCNNPLCFTYSDCHLVEALFLGGENS